MSDAQQKGDLLELAVRAIESAILRASPSYNEKTFTIEGKKMVMVDGVRHEIDVFVSVDLGQGYSAYFIFECKNWVDKVGKNEIIVFTEKIKATQAQKGFFVARSYTSDAEAQAAKDPRIELLRVIDLPLDQIPISVGSFHVISCELKQATITMIKQADIATATNSLQDRPKKDVDLESASFVLDGNQRSLKEYVLEWANAESERRTNAFPSHSSAEGAHELTFDAKRDLSQSKAIVNGEQIIELTLQGITTVSVSHGKVVSHFSVEKRGRAINVLVNVDHEKLKGQFTATFTSGS